MITFKHFLRETESLEDVALQMYFRGAHGLSKTEALAAIEWMRDTESDGDELEIFQKLLDVYGKDMPYDIAKYRGDIAPSEWIHYAIERDMKKHGITAP